MSNPQPGIINVIKPKQPNLPICSETSIILLFHKFWNPSLFFTAKTIFGSIMKSINTSQYIFIQSILHPPQLLISLCQNSSINVLSIIISVINWYKQIISFFTFNIDYITNGFIFSFIEISYRIISKLYIFYF